MSAKLGDIKNNYERLKQELKLVKYTKLQELEKIIPGSNESQFDILMQGIPLAFLPLVHHCFLVYSQNVADFIKDKGFDLYAKSDYRFMESAYKLLVDSFGYKPAISIDQFFKDGFAEHKIILCKDIATLMRQKHAELSKKAPSK